MLKQWLVLLLCFVGVVLTAQAQQQTININQDWYYWENNTKSYQLALENSSWQSITLPHTWNATDTVDTVPGYRRSASWYKRIIPAEAVNPEGLTQLYFEGANFETEVYLNGQRVGEHTGGYIGFTFDITPFLNSTDNNELLVRVSNRFNPNLIPSQKADFFLFGGITRDVWIKHVPTTHITQTHVATPSVSKNQAQTQISIELTSAQNQQANISIYLESPSGEPVSVEQKNVDLVTGNNSLTVDLPTLQDPQLWSPDSPSLYTVTVRLSTALGSMHTDSHSIGYRWFEMKPHQGFFLNGERLLIRGTHRHEEHAGLGAALPNAQHRKDMEMIKQMGANFVRLGHYPQDPEVYQAANELGLLIWDELPWCRGGKGGKEWEANTEYMLTSMINQNMNHPSVIFGHWVTKCTGRKTLLEVVLMM
ncbi:glycoside hydrolase family 2 TIM barrel-domain containing protein [Alteromonas sp. KUL49]|uniref:glycoside hydrolase family 2 protein n=1 Tax=Alteromonas sp. KUL49 TaxID=2480798 RepID=UPI0010FFC6FC|nr:glycoside hydrolase family 2 TIM barrel-domain containing protein [Alteromonas sp. KUL49]GEA10575.1 hypothetical protein KUL49_09500 [Alteromonas sp. KUL49]